MKVIKIKIDRESIKRNPYAGIDQSIIDRGTTINFVFEGIEKPDWIDKTGVIVENVTTDPTGIKIKGRIVNGPATRDFEEFLKDHKTIPGTQFTLHRELETLNHLPEPEYIYKYESTSVMCKHCKKMIDVDAIEVDYILTDEGDIPIETCPECKEEGTFPVRVYENISEALKEVNNGN